MSGPSTIYDPTVVAGLQAQVAELTATVKSLEERLRALEGNRGTGARNDRHTRAGHYARIRYRANRASDSRLCPRTRARRARTRRVHESGQPSAALVGGRHATSSIAACRCRLRCADAPYVPRVTTGDTMSAAGSARSVASAFSVHVVTSPRRRSTATSARERAPALTTGRCLTVTWLVGCLGSPAV